MPSDRPCDESGAICTGDGRRLSNRLEATIAGPASPAAGAFAVSVGGRARGVSGVSVSGSAVVLTLASAVTAGEAVTVGYTVPTTAAVPRIEDEAGNDAAAFSGEAVTNSTSAPVNTPPTGLPAISGTAHVGETLTASASRIADADGLSGATFAWQWISNDGTADTDIAGATEASYTLTAADAGKTVKVRVRFTDDGGIEETLVSAATEPVAIPLTARFENVPETHDGAARFTFDLRFSEEIAISYRTLRDQSLELAGGTVRGARRLARPSNMRWRITVEPDVEGDLTITLPADRACNTAGAICTSGGKRLSSRLDAAVAGPAPPALPEVSIAAQTSPVTEAAAAVFTLTRSGSPSAALTVDVVVTESGAMLKGAPPASVTFAADAGTAALTVETDDDGVDETASTITAAVSAGDGHTVDATAASAAVTEGDAAVFVLRRSGDTTSALTATVSVTEADNVLNGAAPSSVDFAANASEARLRLATEDDDAAEADARVTVTVAAGSGYRVDAGARTARVDVFDDDEAPSRSTVTLWSGEMEVESYGGWLGALGYALNGNGWSENGIDYAIDHIIYVSDELLVGFTTAPEDVDGLTVRLGEVELALAGAGSGASYSWSNVELGWEAGMTVPLRLTRRTEAPVAGPGVSVADARVREAEGASLKFRVTLDTPQASTVSVRYATSDGTAVAGEDYAGVSGALRFAPGETAKTVEVAVFDDAHDEGAETLALTLSRPFGAQLSHAQATGTIANTDPMPRAWLARFGRTVAEHVVEAVDERLTAPREAQSQVTIAGQRVDLEGNAREWDATEVRAARDALETLSGRRRGDVEGRDGFGDSIFARDGAGSDTSRTLTARELLTQSAFHFASEGSGEEGRLTVWGRGAWSGLSGRDDDLSLDGDVATGMAGADFGRDDWLGGLMVSHSEGSGTYTTDGSGASGRSEGEIDSSLTGLYPYLGLDLTERVSVWGVGGYGRGALTLTREGEAPLETDIDMTMAAGGMRGEMLAAGETGGFGLALESDALFVRTTSDAIPGLAAAEADVSRLRLGLEGSYELALDGGGTLVPSLEAAVRHDGGDAETGLGVELGGGLRYEAPSRGLSSEFNLRGLVAHEDGSYEEWGASGSLRYEPTGSSDLGPSLTLTQSWGAPSTGGMESLLGRHTMTGIAAEDAYTPGAHLDAELGYGLSVLDGRAVAIPHVGMSRGNDERTLRLGNRLRLGSSSQWSLEGEFPENGRTVRLGYRYGLGRSFDLSVEAERRASGAGDGAPEYGLWLRASLLW